MIPSSAPQILSTATTGLVNIVTIDNQSIVEEAGFGKIVDVNNSNYTVYFVESNKVFGMPLRNPEHIFVSKT